MTAGDEYLPVPTISRDENVLSAIVNRSTVNALSPTEPSALLDPAADEVDDLDFVSVTHHRHVERVTLEHDQVVLYRDTAPVDLEARQQLVHRQGAGDLVRVAVQGNLQFPKPILAARGGNPQALHPSSTPTRLPRRGPRVSTPTRRSTLGTPGLHPNAAAASGTPELAALLLPQIFPILPPHRANHARRGPQPGASPPSVRRRTS